MARRYYLAGPMSGYPEWNFPAFKAAIKALREHEYVMVCPAELSGLPEQDHLKWEDHMRRDVRLVFELDAVIVLPGWEKSRGARMEVYNALALGMPIFSYEKVAIGFIVSEIPRMQAWKQWTAGHQEWLYTQVAAESASVEGSVCKD